MDSSELIATFSDPSVFLKYIEFILTIISTSVEQGGLAGFSKSSREFFFGGALMLSLTVSGLLGILYMLGQQADIQKTYFEMSFNAIAALFQLTAGSLAINEYSGQTSTEASHANIAGSFCIVASGFYVCDCYYACVNYRSLAKQQQAASASASASASARPGAFVGATAGGDSQEGFP